MIQPGTYPSRLASRLRIIFTEMRFRVWKPHGLKSSAFFVRLNIFVQELCHNSRASELMTRAAQGISTRLSKTSRPSRLTLPCRQTDSLHCWPFTDRLRSPPQQERTCPNSYLVPMSKKDTLQTFFRVGWRVVSLSLGEVPQAATGRP